MAPDTSQKKRKAEGEPEARSSDASDHEQPSSSAEMDVPNGNRAPNDFAKGQRRGKRRDANGALINSDETTQLTQMYEYKSNVFRMETAELLAEVTVDYQKRMGPVEKALHKLKSIIDNISTKEPAMVSGSGWLILLLSTDFS